MPRLKNGKLRITPDGLYQIRYRREGFNVQFTAKTKKLAQERFKEWGQSVNEEKKEQMPHRQTLFGEFALKYFETVKKVNVGEETYDTLFRRFQLHVLPKLGNIPIKNITPMKCQELLNDVLAAGKGRTAEGLKILLKEILRAAMGERLIKQNPMEFVKIPKHQKKHGTALSREEVLAFIEKCETSHYRKQFILFLYKGIRRNELHSVTFDKNFVTVANGKCRKGEAQTYRKIRSRPS